MMSPDTDSSPSQPAKSGVEKTRERILQAAAQVFSEKGYAGATTRAITAEAGVNEVTLFRHFGNKKNLMLAVINRFSALPGLEAALEGQFTGDYRQDLLRIGTHFLAVMDRRRKAILMTMCEAQRQPELREVIAQPPARQRQMLGKYLRQQIERGVVRDLPDPELAAQAFFGMFFEYSINQTLTDPSEPQISQAEVVAQFVDIFVRGTMNSKEESGVES
jgi:AcrR family transcriptional regulator